MSNTALGVFFPFLATILAALIAGAFQVIAAYISSTASPKPPISDILSQVKWWITIILTVVVAILAIAFVLVQVSDSDQCAISNSNWMTYNGGPNSTIQVKPALGSNCKIEVSFDLEKEGWAAVYKKLEPKSLKWTDGIEFSYLGSGDPNTIELKLIDRHDTIYKVVRQNATSTNGEIFRVSFPYTEFTSPSSTKIKPDTIDRIDFSVSNVQPVDVAGSGDIFIDNIQANPSPQYWLIVFSPIFVIGAMIFIAFKKRSKNM